MEPLLEHGLFNTLSVATVAFVSLIVPSCVSLEGMLASRSIRSSVSYI